MNDQKNIRQAVAQTVTMVAVFKGRPAQAVTGRTDLRTGWPSLEDRDIVDIVTEVEFRLELSGKLHDVADIRTADDIIALFQSSG